MEQDWLRTINDLLRGGDDERREARAIMWLEVEDYAVYRAKLPIGPLADDEEERRNISLRVLQKLEKNDYYHIREWERRQRNGVDSASWWGFVGLVTKRMAIDQARTSKRNLARRGEPFVWAIVEPRPPISFAEPESSTVRFLSHCDEPKFYDFIDKVNRTCARKPAPAPEPAPGPEPPLIAPVPPRRGPGR